jgi:hypothetical protein
VKRCFLCSFVFKCSLGKNSHACCGVCTPARRCACKNGIWDCYFLDACALPTCQNETWDELIGMTYKKAKETILSKYPKMKLVCKKEDASHMPFKNDRHRYVIYTTIYTTKGDTVTNIVFNEMTE